MNGICMNGETASVVSRLNHEEAGKITLAMIAMANETEPPAMSGALLLVWEMILAMIGSDSASNKTICASDISVGETVGETAETVGEKADTPTEVIDKVTEKVTEEVPKKRKKRTVTDAERESKSRAAKARWAKKKAIADDVQHVEHTRLFDECPIPIEVVQEDGTTVKCELFSDDGYREPMAENAENDATPVEESEWYSVAEEVASAETIQKETPVQGTAVEKATADDTETAKKKWCEEKFDLFWAAYPRKQDKKRGKSAFLRIDGLTEELFSNIMAALEKRKSSYDWIKDGGKFIPLPTSWINGRRWEDVLTVEKTGQGTKYKTTEDIMADPQGFVDEFFGRE